jgi:hypothetical protein
MPEYDELELLVLRQAYEDSKVSYTHILRAGNMLKDVIIKEEMFHPTKGEYVVELNGNRIALIYVIKRNEDGKKILGIKHARYLKGKPKARKMVER